MLRTHKFARNALYNLKRRYGSVGYYYHIVAATDNMQTGVSSQTKTRYTIAKMILLPSTMTREMLVAGGYTRKPDRSYSGPEYDSESALIIIDKEDMPVGFTYTVADYVIAHVQVRRRLVSRRRFNILKMEELEDGCSFLITGRYLRDGAYDEIVTANVSEKLISNQSPTGLVEQASDEGDDSSILPASLPLKFLG